MKNLEPRPRSGTLIAAGLKEFLDVYDRIFSASRVKPFNHSESYASVLNCPIDETVLCAAHPPGEDEDCAECPIRAFSSAEAYFKHRIVLILGSRSLTGFIQSFIFERKGERISDELSQDLAISVFLLWKKCLTSYFKQYFGQRRLEEWILEAFQSIRQAGNRVELEKARRSLLFHNGIGWYDTTFNSALTGSFEESRQVMQNLLSDLQKHTDAYTCRLLFFNTYIERDKLYDCLHYDSLVDTEYYEYHATANLEDATSLVSYALLNGPLKVDVEKRDTYFDALLADIEKGYLSGTVESLLIIPVSNRRGDPIGCVVLETKQDRSVQKKEGIGVQDFTLADEFIARESVKSLEKLVDRIRKEFIFENLRHVYRTEEDIETFRDIFFNCGLSLIEAEAGRFIYYYKDTGEPDQVCSHNIENHISTYKDLPPSEILPQQGEIEDVVLAREGQIEAFSIIQIPLIWRGRTYGLFEASAMGPNAFIEQDIVLCERMSDYASLHDMLVEKEKAFEDAVLQTSGVEYKKETLENILDIIKQSTGIPYGIIYIADYEKKALQCAVSQSKRRPITPTEVFSYNFDDFALATSVFNTREPIFTEDHKQANHKGILAFGIEGPIMGLPLVHKKECVGVLVLWGGGIQEKLIKDLNGLSGLAAQLIHVHLLEQQRARIGSGLQNIRQSIQKGADVKETLQELFSGILDLGFKRVRLYSLDEEQEAFVLDESVGMRDPANVYKHVIPLKNPYAHHTVQTAHDNPVTRIYGPDNDLGPDLFTEKLEKPENMPWAVLPLVYEGKTVGQIVADTNSATRPITPMMQEFLNDFGTEVSRCLVKYRLFRVPT